jgi:uncharacterized protein (TIGR03435 family)
MRMVAVVLMSAGSMASPLWAQSPVFEVTSVKVNRTGDGGSNAPRLTNGRLTAENTTLRTILQVAYGLGPVQINGPAWIDSDRFDLDAKSPQGVPDAALMPMLQALVKDRFQLTAHRETRDAPVYELTVMKAGPKFSAFDPAHVPPTPPRNGAGAMIIGPMTMDGLAGSLSRAAGRPVVNRTGLSGRYFCAVTYSPLSAQVNGDSGPGDIFAAVQEQLGLKLESAKAPIEFLVVDHAERVPTEN